MTAGYHILSQPWRTLDGPAGSAHRTGRIETLKRTHNSPVPSARAVIEMRRETVVGHPRHRFDNLIHTLFTLIPVCQRQLRTGLDVYHERHSDTSVAGPLRIGRVSAVSAEITGA